MSRVTAHIHGYALIVLSLPVLICGCHRWHRGPYDMGMTPTAPIEVPVANPANVGELDPDFLWRMIVDSVDDYFRIDLEQPVRRDNLNWLEGRLKTFPETSGTSFEPWRREAAPGFERLQSTFQTVRRTATVRVIPETTGYQIAIEVMKEQEDVDQSQFAASGAASQRHDGTIVRQQNQVRQLPVTLGWYEIGRDRDLERRIMEGILGRITNVEPPRHKVLH